MTLSKRQIAPESKPCHELGLDALACIVPRDTLLEVLNREGTLDKEKRERKLNLCSTMWLLITQGLFAEQSMTSLLHTMSFGTNLESAQGEQTPMVSASAVSYRRRQLGVAPLRALMHTLCQPLATPQTPRAFRFGLRLIAVDRTIESVPDSPAKLHLYRIWRYYVKNALDDCRRSRNCANGDASFI